MRSTVRALLDAVGTTYAEQAGIILADRPSPLYRLLVLTVLLAHRIQADIAVAAARELFRAGYTSPRRMLDASWQQRVDALGRGDFVRYDESTATALGGGAQLVLDTYHGDLRRLRRKADGDRRAVRRSVQRVPRIGPTGWGCPPTRRNWPTWCPATRSPRSRQRWCGWRSTGISPGRSPTGRDRYQLVGSGMPSV